MNKPHIEKMQREFMLRALFELEQQLKQIGFPPTHPRFQQVRSAFLCAAKPILYAFEIFSSFSKEPEHTEPFWESFGEHMAQFDGEQDS